MENITSAVPADSRILATLCYIVRDGQALMLKRGKEPNFGLYTAPGGRLEPGESPYECVCREILEETGLTLQDPILKAIVTEAGPLNQLEQKRYTVHYGPEWLLFIFRASSCSGSVIDCDEGELSWIPCSQILNHDIPEADKLFTPYILEESDMLRHMVFHYDLDGKLKEHCIR